MQRNIGYNLAVLRQLFSIILRCGSLNTMFEENCSRTCNNATIGLNYIEVWLEQRQSITTSLIPINYKYRCHHTFSISPVWFEQRQEQSSSFRFLLTSRLSRLIISFISGSFWATWRQISRTVPFGSPYKK